MKYKLMAVDIDGTLLNEKSELTENTKKTILKAVEKGLIFTIATGRPIQGIEVLNKELNLDTPFITYNGAIVVLGKSKEVIYQKNLSRRDSMDVVHLAKKHNLTYMIWKDGNLFVPEFNELVDKYKSISSVQPILIDNLDTLLENGVTKILWYDSAEKIAEYHSQIGQCLSASVNFHPSRPYFMEFVDVKASKAVALEQIGVHYGIKQSEMIAVGDGYNDLSMIEYAGLGVAMANSPDGVKQRADYITLSNEEDGVAHVIDKFILNNDLI